MGLEKLRYLREKEERPSWVRGSQRGRKKIGKDGVTETEGRKCRKGRRA